MVDTVFWRLCGALKSVIRPLARQDNVGWYKAVVTCFEFLLIIIISAAYRRTKNESKSELLWKIRNSPLRIFHSEKFNVANRWSHKGITLCRNSWFPRLFPSTGSSTAWLVDNLQSGLFPPPRVSQRLILPWRAWDAGYLQKAPPGASVSPAWPCLD